MGVGGLYRSRSPLLIFALKCSANFMSYFLMASMALSIALEIVLEFLLPNPFVFPL